MVLHPPEGGSLRQLKEERLAKHINPTPQTSAITSFLESLSSKDIKPAPSEHLRAARLTCLTVLDAEIAKEAKEEAKKQARKAASIFDSDADDEDEDNTESNRKEPKSRFTSKTAILKDATLPSGHLKPASLATSTSAPPSTPPLSTPSPPASSSSSSASPSPTTSDTNHNDDNNSSDNKDKTNTSPPEAPTPKPTPTPTQAHTLRARKLSKSKKQVKARLLRSKNFVGLQANNNAAETLRARQAIWLRNRLDNQSRRQLLVMRRDRGLRRVDRRIRETLEILAV